MAKAYVFYNPLAGNGRCQTSVEKLSGMVSDELVLCDWTQSDTRRLRLSQLSPNDYIIVCGGDGTLNSFVNTVDCDHLPNDVYYYPAGTGNDFANDLGAKYECPPICINEYIRALPSVQVNGKKHLFLNGIGYGLDGYCCDEGDRIKQKTHKAVNYTALALKALFISYKPASATVTIDGVSRSYKKVWLAPAMHGRFFGGGMMPTPAQQRSNPDGTLSVMIVHDIGRLKILSLFPHIFKGTHLKHTECIDLLTGHTITVSFSRPSALQIDGEVIPNVLSYTAKSGKDMSMVMAKGA